MEKTNGPVLSLQGVSAPRPAEQALQPELPKTLPVDDARLKVLMSTLRAYKAGKTRTEQRIVASENWWKLRNQSHPEGEQEFCSRSGWLHNVIVSKHADAMAAYPEPAILPREPDDRPQAQILSAILPCVLEQNRFEQTYSDAMWQKLKTGTGVYKVVWDADKLGGLGDISVGRVNLLNLYWEPGITDIQASRYLFHTELCDRELLRQAYPQLQTKLKGNTFLSTRFLYDDAVDTGSKATVVEVYYRSGGKLHYCKFVEDTVLYATENDPALAQRGLYDHGQYPYIFDALFPIEGSPCGYGFVDLCRNPQTEIDLLKTAFLRNARAGAVPRFFSRTDGNINEEEFLDLSRSVVHVAGNVDEASIRRIEHNSLDGNYLGVLDRTIDELRQTSGNTETSTGTVSSGVTAAAAIAALQEASGKGSRDATQASYRAYSRMIELCIELIRQFYTLPRQFRITGQQGAEEFVSYTNQALQPQPQGNAFGQELGMRKPVFDIRVSAQKHSAYTRMTQNELALQFFQLGFFNPQLTQQALLCLDMMDFDGKEEIRRRVARGDASRQKLAGALQLAAELSRTAAPQMTQGLLQELSALTGQPAPAAHTPAAPTGADAARMQAQSAPIPGEGGL